MDTQDYTTEHRKGQHLLAEERHEIEVRLKDGWSIYQITKHLGRPFNTIKNEIARGTVYLYNGLIGIRNECIHGLNYCQGSQLLFGFKVTLIALYMIGWRTELVLKNMSGTTEGTVENQEQEDKAINKYKSFWLKILQFIKKAFHT